ncbi:MAG: restriction endonuclease subunit S [Magnetococcales bacterium]|nr:restriction endonuclease subunit S [Magnetococcales bacterium]
MSGRPLKPGWRMVKFGEVVRQCKESVDRDNNSFERYVEGGHMDSEDVHIRRWGEFGEDYVGPAFHRVFRKGQVLYGSRRTYLKKVALADFDGITANTTLVLETKDQNMFLQELLPFLMLTDSFTQHSIQESKGSTNPYINWPDIAKYEFPLPPIEEQRRIAEILWAADEVVKTYGAARKQLSILLTSLRDAEMCSPSFRKICLGYFLEDIVAGKSVVGGNEFAGPDEYGVLKVSAVGADGFVPQENKRLMHQDDFLEKYQVRKGSLLITRCNTSELVGRVCITNNDYPNLMLCDKTLELVVNPGIASKRFIFQLLRSRFARSQIMASATGTGEAMKNISQSDIRSIVVTAPPLDEQSRLADYAESISQEAERIDSQLKSSKALSKRLFDGLLETGVSVDG